MHIHAIVVLYGQSPDESTTLESLLECGTQADFSLTIWDNSPRPHRLSSALSFRLESTFGRVVFLQDPSNPGLAKAYNQAAAAMPSECNGWLLTLDQDTRLPRDFLSALRNACERDQSNDVALICPKVQDGARYVSPMPIKFGFPWPRTELRSTGVISGPISAINSGSCTRVAFLKEVNGYNECYPLDYLDHWLCREVWLRQWKFDILPIEIQHNLSLNRFDSSVSPERYRQILRAQRQFVVSSPSRLPRYCHSLQLLSHAVTRSLKAKSRSYARVAWNELRDFWTQSSSTPKEI